jgi:hypothetical protein
MVEAEAPAVRVDVLETVVELLGHVEGAGSSDAFYSSLCEAVCRVSAMDRAVIFRYDAARRRVRAAGAFGLSLDRFAEAHVTVESAPIARQALEEDRVIDVDAEVARRELPATFHDLLDDATLVCAPLSAGGRWSGVILADRRPRRALSDEERHVLWTLGKISSLAEVARSATYQSLRARQLQERINLAREVHEGVIQRLFGVTLAFSSEAELPREARERIVVELQAALRDLRRAQRAGDGDDASRGDRAPAAGASRARAAAHAGQPPGAGAARAGAAGAVRARRGGAQRAQARLAAQGGGLAAQPGRRVDHGGLQRRRARPAPLRGRGHGPQARRARGPPGRRDRGVRRARARDLARTAGGAA